METIFHEKQEGSLCAQHCLNALLQGQYFSPVDLADLARQLDEQEREQMAVGGQTDEYRRFLEQPSSNFDDSGFFSIQVIENAVRVWGLELIQYNSQDPIAVDARQHPVNEKAFICNFREHWFAVRKLGYQWFNLNSLLTGPELISDTYLSLFLTQLQQEGYSIFIVRGDLPECEADQILRFAPAVQPIKPRLINESQAISKSDEPHDEHLEQAIAESRHLVDSDDKMLQKALQMSMEGYVIEDDEKGEDSGGTTSGQTLNSEEIPNNSTQPVSQEDLRQKRLAYLNKLDNASPQTSCDNSSVSESKEQYTTVPKTQNKTNKKPTCTITHESNEEPQEISSNSQETQENGDVTEEDLLKQAIAMSMEGMN